MTTDEYVRKELKPIFDGLVDKGKQFMVVFIACFFISQIKIALHELYGGPKDDK